MWHYVNSISSPEQAAESLAASFADMYQCAPLSWKNTLEKSCCSDSVTESSHGSPSGMMSAPSTETNGEDKLTSCAGASLAKTSARPGKELASTEKDQGFGLRWPELSAKYDRSTFSWKIHPCLFPEDSIGCSVTLPRWGTMLNGVCSAHVTPAEITCARGYGYLPTVRRSGQSRAFKAYVRDAYQGNFEEFLGKIGFLGFITNQLGEALMMWPIGWTDIAPLATDKFRQWLHSHGESYQEETDG